LGKDVSFYYHGLKLDDVDFVRSLYGSQLQVIARGEGYAQTFLRTSSKGVDLIETDVEGAVIRTVRRISALNHR
jgi:hypothetical protein